jgi:hypothetical protein
MSSLPELDTKQAKKNINRTNGGDFLRTDNLVLNKRAVAHKRSN